MKSIKKTLAVFITVCFVLILSLTAFAEPSTTGLLGKDTVAIDNTDNISLILKIRPSSGQVIESIEGNFTVTPSNSSTQAAITKAAGSPYPEMESGGKFKISTPCEKANLFFFAEVDGTPKVNDTFTFTVNLTVKEKGSDTPTTLTATKVVKVVEASTTTSTTKKKPDDNTTKPSTNTTTRPTYSRTTTTKKRNRNSAPGFTFAPISKVPVYTVAETTDPQSAIRIDKSEDVLLKTLKVNDGLYPLNPDFDPTIPYYVVEVPSSVKSLDIKAKPKDPKADVTVTGADKLVPNEDNLITVTVNTPDGNKTEYTIKVKFNDNAASGKSKVVFPKWIIAIFSIAAIAVIALIVIAIIKHVNNSKMTPNMKDSNKDLVDSLSDYSSIDKK